MSHFRSFSMTILLLLVTISPFAFAVDNQPNEVGPQEHELESEWNVIEHESVIASSLKPSSRELFTWRRVRSTPLTLSIHSSHPL